MWSLLQEDPQCLSRVLLDFKAVFFALLLGIKRLSEFDTREHSLKTLIGHGYQSSTLESALGVGRANVHFFFKTVKSANQ